MMIKDFIDERPMVSLFTRPRRFGKNLNMDMLRAFFKPKGKNLPGIIIELKAEKNCTDEHLKKMSETALRQIIDKKYDTEMTMAGVKTIYKYGVAFSGKKVEVAVS